MKIVGSTSTDGYGLYERTHAALEARALVLVVDNSERRRTEFVRDLCRTYIRQPGYSPAIVTTPARGSDAQLMRLIAVAVELPPLHTRYALWRNFEAYCRTQYEQGSRVLLIFADAHLMSGVMLRLLHGLSTITMGNDLAVQMVLVGRNDLAVKLQHPSRRALWSRIGARVSLESTFRSV